jgi:hypothetical protein
MKVSIKRLSVTVIPYLILSSLCYTSGYWSNIKIDIYNYYQAQDILKSLGNPLFGFVGLAFYPVISVINILASWHEKAPTKESAPAAVETATEEKQEEHTWWEKGLIYLFSLPVVGIILTLGFGLIIGFIAAVSLPLVPIEDYSSYARIYLSTLGLMNVVRIIVLLIVAPTLLGWIVKERIQKPTPTIAALISYTILPFLIAYHFGKMESYKALMGLEFRYMEVAGKPLKYLGKADTYYFFSEDRSYVPYQAETPTRLANNYYDQTIRVVSADSLKSFSLRRYSNREPLGALKLAGFLERH